MSETKQCTLHFGTLEIKLEGEIDFVDRLHLKIDNDLRELIDGPSSKKSKNEHHILIHQLLGDITKVYAAPLAELAVRPIGSALHIRHLKHVFLEKVPLSIVINPLNKRTLWSHFQSGAYKTVKQAPETQTKPPAITQRPSTKTVAPPFRRRRPTNKSDAKKIESAENEQNFELKSKKKKIPVTRGGTLRIILPD